MMLTFITLISDDFIINSLHIYLIINKAVGLMTSSDNKPGAIQSLVVEEDKLYKWNELTHPVNTININIGLSSVNWQQSKDKIIVKVTTISLVPNTPSVRLTGQICSIPIQLNQYQI